MASSSGKVEGEGDRIVIPGIRARCILGVHARERRKPRPVVVSLAIETDLAAAAAADDLALTVDYSLVTRRVREAVAGTRFALLEALAAFVADTVLATPRVRAVEVTVGKPAAVRGAGTPRVVIRRARP
jgi:7,8-dihydroneopterin aldolase/epimerase/oxygenase